MQCGPPKDSTGLGRPCPRALLETGVLNAYPPTREAFLRDFRALADRILEAGTASPPGCADAPTLLLIGDEDEPCLDVNLYLKRVMPWAGLAVVPRTGHTVNLEEPLIFNRLLDEFFTAVEDGSWTPRDANAELIQVISRDPGKWL